MSTLQMVITVIHLIVAIALIVVVIGQSGKSEGLGSSFGGGNSETFLAKNKAKSRDAILTRATKWIAIAFMVLTLALCVI